MGTIKDTVTKDIQGQKADGIVEKSKYEQALEQYDLNITDEEVKAAVTKIIAEKVSENDNLEVKKFLLGSVELTTLSTSDTEEKVLAMIEKVNRFDSEYPDLPHVAAVCAYPCFTKLMADILWVLICLANQTGIDLTEELRKSFDKKTIRDKDRHKNNPKLK